MTKRLEAAIRRLAPENIAKLEVIAENLAAEDHDKAAPRFLKLDWVGKASDMYPEESGVEAAHAAGKMMRDAVERNLSK